MCVALFVGNRSLVLTIRICMYLMILMQKINPGSVCFCVLYTLAVEADFHLVLSRTRPIVPFHFSCSVMRMRFCWAGHVSTVDHAWPPVTISSL